MVLGAWQGGGTVEMHLLVSTVKPEKAKPQRALGWREGAEWAGAEFTRVKGLKAAWWLVAGRMEIGRCRCRDHSVQVFSSYNLRSSFSPLQMKPGLLL